MEYRQTPNQSSTHTEIARAITIPEVSIYKSEQNILMVEIWIAEELFNYLHPFLFSDLFQQQLTKH